MIDRKSRVLCDDDIKEISDIYHSWRDEKGYPQYHDIAGFSKSGNMEDIRENNYVLTPRRCVVTEDQEEDDEEFHGTMERLVSELKQQME